MLKLAAASIVSVVVLILLFRRASKDEKNATTKTYVLSVGVLLTGALVIALFMMYRKRGSAMAKWLHDFSPKAAAFPEYYAHRAMKYRIR